MALGRIFDVALFVRYLPFSKFLHATWDTAPDNFEAVSYDDEVDSVQFFEEALPGNYVKALRENNSGQRYTTLKLEKEPMDGIITIAIDSGERVFAVRRSFGE